MTKDKSMPNPVRVSDVAEFLNVPVWTVRFSLSCIYPTDPVPSGQDRLLPIEAQALAATLTLDKWTSRSRGKENGKN